MTNLSVQTKETTKRISLHDHIERTLERVRKARDAVNLHSSIGEELWDELGTAENALMNALILTCV